jgi:hypothetical protein
MISVVKDSNHIQTRMPYCASRQGYLAKNTIPMVNSAVVMSKTLWPQRAISPSMSISGYIYHDPTMCMAAISLHHYKRDTQH